MLMVKPLHKRTPQEKERIILDIQNLGGSIPNCVYRSFSLSAKIDIFLILIF